MFDIDNPQYYANNECKKGHQSIVEVSVAKVVIEV